MPFTIGACGFSATGSSSVTDYLKEFDENVVLDRMEFTLAYTPDGLLDLRYHLHEGGMRDISGRFALKRYERLCKNFGSRGYRRLTNGRFNELTSQYIQGLSQAEWVGLCNYSDAHSITTKIFRKYRIFKFIDKLEKKVGHELAIYPCQKVAMSIYPENFDERTKEYVMSILDALGRQKDKNLVLDQPFSGNNPEASFPFFENPKAIVVDRDPRDYYLFQKIVLKPSGHRVIPTNTVENFVTFYRKERENMPYRNGNPNILLIQFEDMIYRYEETTKKICDFCELEPGNSKRKIFAPELSIANTQLFKRFPEYAEDIQYIEKELKEYLYPYEDFGDINTDGKMFYGKSPLNKG